jgi:ABC-type transport system substrate-binding protein
MSVIFSIDGQCFGKSPEPIIKTLATEDPINFGKFKNARYDALMNRALVTKDANSRSRIYGQLSDIAAEQVGMIPPVYPHFILAVRKNVKGLPIPPLRINRILFRTVSV